MNPSAILPRFFSKEEIGSVRLIRNLYVRKKSEIWYGVDLKKGDEVAIKFHYPEYLHKEHFEALSQFLLHVESSAFIRALHADTTVNSHPYIVMQYAGKGSLRTFLKRNGPCSFAHGVYLLRQMLSALSILYKEKIVHRDIKPENIWITEDGVLHLGDFGIARFPSVPEEAGKVFGSARYCSPEQAFDSTKADFRSDLYSLGAVVFEALTGTFFRKEDSFSAAVCRKEVNFDPLYDVATENFAGLLKDLTAFDPRKRSDPPEVFLARLEKMGLPEAFFLS